VELMATIRAREERQAKAQAEAAGEKSGLLGFHERMVRKMKRNR
jgi:hypothetical protein